MLQTLQIETLSIKSIILTSIIVLRREISLNLMGAKDVMILKIFGETGNWRFEECFLFCGGMLVKEIHRSIIIKQVCKVFWLFSKQTSKSVDPL